MGEANINQEVLQYNYDFIVKRKQIHVGFIPTIILDSQIIDYLDRYLNKPNRNSAEYNATRQLLKFVVEKNYDYNPFFYVLEAVITNGKEGARPYVTRLAKTILQFHTMDETVFLEEDRITRDRKRCKEYAHQYRLNCIDSNFFTDIANLWTDAMFSNIGKLANLVQEILDYSYAVLLKMALVHKGSKHKVVKKMQSFSDFLERELNLALGRELAIAAYYFSNRLPPRFVTIESNMAFEEVRRKMRSTTRDLLLLRMPEILLLNGTEKETVLGFVCSADKAIRALGRLFTIEYVDALPRNYSLPNSVHINMEKLEQELGNEVVEPLLRKQNQRTVARLSTDRREHISKEQLRNLIFSLEEQVKALCRD